MKQFKSLKKECLKANQQLPALGLVLFTFGNVSVADHKQKVFAIKPSGVPYSELTSESMVIVDFDGHILDGKLRPSSDTKTHAFLYKNWNKIGSIVHTHSTFATAWAQAQREIPIYGTTHADHLTEAVPCAPPMNDEMIKGDYETETGNQIISYFIEKKFDYQKIEMILIGNHAPFTWGNNSQKALYNAAVLEEIARMAWLTEQINPTSPLLKDALIKKHFERKHGPDSYYGQ